MPLAPSRPEGVELGPVPAAASPLAERDAARSTGSAAAGWCTRCCSTCRRCRRRPRADAARAWLDRPGHELPAGEAAARLAEEVLAILAHPELAPLFGPAAAPRCR